MGKRYKHNKQLVYWLASLYRHTKKDALKNVIGRYWLFYRERKARRMYLTGDNMRVQKANHVNYGSQHYVWYPMDNTAPYPYRLSLVERKTRKHTNQHLQIETYSVQMEIGLCKLQRLHLSIDQMQ